jgi:FkbM family methyltransferase
VGGQFLILRERSDLVMALVAGVIAAGLTALVFETLTDRDWSLQGWEWPQVLAADVILALGAIWGLSLVASRNTPEGSSHLARVLKAGAEQLGYRIERTPPLASDPGYALELDFDFVLADYLGRREDARPFFFVQVGAFDGVTHDRLFEHVREGGWHGVLAEPQPRYFERLVQNYKGLEGLTFIKAAVDRERGSRELYCYQDERGEPIDSVAGLASFSRERLLDWQQRMGDRAPVGMRIGSAPVTCITFEDMLAEVDYLDLIHIDAESYDLELLKVLDFERFAPAIVRFEHVHLSREDWDEAVKILAGYGYRVLREEYDTTAYRQPS